MSLGDQIVAWLKGCEKAAFLGIGNPMRGDDAIGMEVVKLLKGKVPRNVKLFECQTVPENFTREIRRFKPTHVLMIDAAQLEAKPGEASLVTPDEILGMALSTHTMPLYILAKVIRKSVNAKVMILGVQPKSVGFGEEITPELQKASKEIVNLLIESLNKLGK